MDVSGCGFELLKTVLHEGPYGCNWVMCTLIIGLISTMNLRVDLKPPKPSEPLLVAARSEELQHVVS